MRFIRYAVLTLAVGMPVGITKAYALDLKSPFDLESTKVLPAKARNPRIKNVTMSVEDKFDGTGLSLPLGQKLNKRVNWNDILASQSTDLDRDLVTGTLASEGLDRNGSPGQTTGQVTTLANVMVPALAYGVTDKITIAAALPVYNVKVNADTGFVKSEDGQRFVDAVCANNPQRCNEARDKLNNAVNQKLSRLGYESIGPMEVSGVGDARVIGKYQFTTYKVAGGLSTSALKPEVSIPTGKKVNADRALDVPTGEGHVNTGLTMIHDYRLSDASSWNFNQYAGYLYQFADQIDRRLPTSDTDTLSADKESLSRKAGDIIQAGSSVSYEWLRTGLTFGAGYSFQFLNRTTFDGSDYDISRYRWLESEFPSQTLHSGIATLGFSTVHFYKQKRFFYPFQANLAYSRPLAGRNVTTNSVLGAELVLFF